MSNSPVPLLASVELTANLARLAGRTFSIEDISLMSYYNSNITYSDRKGILFDSGKFTGITFIRRHDGKYSVFALPHDLDHGPEYYINKDNIKGNEHIFDLRNIVINYLDNHKELGLTIDNFL